MKHGPAVPPISLEEIKAAKSVRGTFCEFSSFIAALSKADQTTLRVAVDDPAIESSAIWRVMRTRGYRGSQVTVRRHRHGDPCRSAVCAAFFGRTP